MTETNRKKEKVVAMTRKKTKLKKSNIYTTGDLMCTL